MCVFYMCVSACVSRCVNYYVNQVLACIHHVHTLEPYAHTWTICGMNAAISTSDKELRHLMANVRMFTSTNLKRKVRT